MKFPYVAYRMAPFPTAPNGLIHRPEVSVRVIGPNGAFPVQASVDPGSDDSLIPLTIARAIGARMDASQTWHVEGVGGHAVLVTLAEVLLELTDEAQTFRWQTKVGVVDFTDPTNEVTVLGHAGFLDYFRVVFDGHLHELTIEATPGFPGQIV